MRALLAQLRREIFALAVTPSMYGLLAVWYLLNGLLFFYLLEYKSS